MKAGVVILSLFLGAAFSCLGLAQQSGGVESKTDEMSALRGQVATLSDQLREIVDRLNELKQLVTANGPLRPAPQPPAPPSVLTTQNENFRGGSDATVAIIEYADFECPFCGQYEQDIYPEISKDYIQTGKVKYFYRDLPLPMHPHAMIAARAAHCAGEQGKYWEMHDSLFAKQNAIRDVDMPGRAQELELNAAKFSECLASDRYTDEIKKSAAEALKLGIGGTPTFFVGKVKPNGDVTNPKMIIGSRPYEAFKSVINDFLAAKAAP